MTINEDSMAEGLGMTVTRGALCDPRVSRVMRNERSSLPRSWLVDLFSHAPPLPNLHLT